MGTDIANTFVRPLNSEQREHAVKDLSKLTKPQLLEMRDRQAIILRNKSFLAKLPDKGKRIEELYERILCELKQKDEVEQAAQLFSELNISSKGTKFVTKLEWTGDLRSSVADDNSVQVEVEEETDPLRILAQARDKQKIVKIEKPEESLITPEDLKDIQEIRKLNLSAESSCSSSQLDQHASYLCGKEALQNSRSAKFKPYQTTKSNVHDPDKEVQKTFKHKEVTAATPPLLRHPGTRMLSLQESLELQMQQERELREKQQREAELKLAERATRVKARDFVAKDISEFFKSYRVVNESSDEDEETTTGDEYDSAEEVLDEDAREETGGVHFNVQE